MTLRLDGKRALVIGGGSGLGLSCAEEMAKAGAAVFISSRSSDRLAAAAHQVSELGRVGWAAGDATVADDVERTLARAADFLGGLDTVVVSAGLGGVTSIFSTAPEDFERIVRVNLLPVFLVARLAAGRLVAAGSGSLIAISSIYGLVGQRERVAYCAAKHAVVGLVRAMALDFAGQGVRANAICPGYIETELAVAVAQEEADPGAALEAYRRMHPIPRPGRPEEVGRAAVYLASDDAAWITGQCLTIDGGYTAR